MIKVTKQMADAFYNGRNMRVGNTEVRDGSIYLHGNKIAFRDSEGIWVSTSGWNTRTTFERLNGLHGCHVFQKNYVVYLNGNEWYGGWIKL